MDYLLSLHKNLSFPLIPADLVTFTEGILMENFIFCAFYFLLFQCNFGIPTYLLYLLS